MARALVVGGGIIGTAHAHEAVTRGLDVVHFEADAEARKASARSLGILSFSAAAPGLDLKVSLQASLDWSEMLESPDGRSAGNLLRRTGSHTVAIDSAEMDFLERMASGEDAASRGWKLLDRAESQAHEPGLGGTYAGTLYSGMDAVIEPAAVLSRLRAGMDSTGRYSYRAGTEILEVESDAVVDQSGRVTKGDLVVICPGANFRLAASALRQPGTMRAVRLQAVETGPTPHRISAPLWDLASLRAHGIEGGGPWRSVEPGEQSGYMRVKAVPRPNGRLLVGEVQEQDDPHGFDLRDRPMSEVVRRLEGILGFALPGVTRRWSGTVYESTDGRLWHRDDLDDSVALVAGTDERGVTLAPAIARDTFDWLLDGRDSGATRPGAKQA